MDNILLSPPAAASGLCVCFSRHEFPASEEKPLHQTKPPERLQPNSGLPAPCTGAGNLRGVSCSPSEKQQQQSSWGAQGLAGDRQQSGQCTGWSGRLLGGRAMCCLSYGGTLSCILQAVLSSVVQVIFRYAPF